MLEKLSTSKYQLYNYLFVMMLLQIVSTDRIFLQKFPVNRILSIQTEIRLNRLKQFLNKYPIHQNKQQLYLRAKLCEVYLTELAKQSMSDYDNLMNGNTNLVQGANNIVLGSQNKVKGQGNWIFSTNYDDPSDRVLVIDKWKINIDKIEQIRVNPDKVIQIW